MDDNQKLGLSHVNFEMPIKFLSGNVKKMIGYSVEVQRRVPEDR